MELKKCPFCGGDVEMIRPFPNVKTLKVLRFICKNPVCQAHVEFQNIAADFSEDEAVKNWNARAAE